MKNNISVYIADDHTLFRKAMVNLLKTFDRVGEIKDAENGKELIALVKKQPPDVVIVDLQMPIMDGTEACAYLVNKFPDLKLIVLTMHDSDRYATHMIELGVHAFLLKNAEPEELEKAIYAVLENDFYHNELVALLIRRNLKGLKPSFLSVELSDREKEVLFWICRELTIREIGQRLSLSENTIRNHRANIMDKIGVKNVVGMVKYAYQTGLVV